MDIIEEIDIFAGFVSATNVNPELFVEWAPASLIVNALFAPQEWYNVEKVLMFPHILGKPWTPRETCIHLTTDVYKAKKYQNVWCYNGFIYAYEEYYDHDMVLSIIRKNGYYVGEYPDGSKFTTDSNNLFIEQHVSTDLYTRFGKFEMDWESRTIENPEYGGRITGIYEMVTDRALEKQYYQLDGTPVKSPYTGILFGGIPAGCNDYRVISKELLSIKTLPKDTKCTDIGELNYYKPKVTNIEIPMIRGMADLIAYVRGS